MLTVSDSGKDFVVGPVPRLVFKGVATDAGTTRRPRPHDDG